MRRAVSTRPMRRTKCALYINIYIYIYIYIYIPTYTFSPHPQTHTMIGGDDAAGGLYSLAAAECFAILRCPQFSSLALSVSFFEIYREAAFDLLPLRSPRARGNDEAAAPVKVKRSPCHTHGLTRHTHTHTHTHTYIYIYIYMYIYVNIYIYTYTYIHRVNPPIHVYTTNLY